MKNFVPTYTFRKPFALVLAFALSATIGFGNCDSIFGQSDTEARSSKNEQATAPATTTEQSKAVTNAAGTNAQKASAKKQEPTKFLRTVNDSEGKPLAMQTAITRYRPSKGDLVVDLIGAVHIGEGDYYAKLNQQFEHYDVVLYELVAPQGTRIPAGGKREKKSSGSPLDMVGWMQKQAQSTLGLESQLEKIDYQKKNFTHADLSPTEMGEKMAERGDTPITLGLSALSEMMRQQNKAAKDAKSGKSSLANQLSSQSLMELINDPLKMKLVMASQFSQSGVMEMGLGATLNQLVVTDRNVAAMKVMQKEIVKGKKKIAIFYGAAHMPDFEKRLIEEFGMAKTKQIWVDAWDLTKAGKKPKTNSTTKMLFRLLDEFAK